MRSWWFCVPSAVLVAAAAIPSDGAEPYLPFLEGLRERGYYDYVLLYLDQIEQDPKTPAEVRRVAPYERAMTLLNDTTSGRGPDDRAAQLDQAGKLLEQFVQANPADPRSAQADSERARILLDRARVQVWQSLVPANEGRRAELQEEARGLVDRAQEIYQAAHDKFKTAYDAFPKRPITDKAEAEARTAAELGYIQARIDLAKCTYERAQTFPPAAPERHEILKQAARQFEDIHTAYRSMTAGLVARMWQGKCFEEMDEIGKALGIYKELIGHPGKSATITNIKSQAQQFQLICLNHPQRNEFQIVVDTASEWLNSAGKAARTRTGLGIRWERARAYEQLSLARDLSAAERDKRLKLALDDAKFIRGFEGQYREPAATMERRLDLLLKGENARPQDFDTAFVLANSYIRRVGELDTKLRATKDSDTEGKAQAKQDLDAQLAEAEPMLRLALDLAEDDTDPRQINTVRVWLGHVARLSGRSLDAAVIGEFIARKYRQEQPETALNAAYLALGAYHQAYQQAPPDDRSFELDRMLDVGNYLAATWPESDKANEARLQLGGIYRQRDQPLEAAKWYAQVPASVHQYADAQRQAGAAYWSGYAQALNAPEEDRPPADELQKWVDEAERHLRTAIEKHEADLAPNAPPAPEFVTARLALVEILNHKGDYPEAVRWLAEGPRSVVSAIQVENEADRPRTGVKSRDYAAQVYQLLLRAYVGDRRIDDALAAMDALEKVGGADQIAIYVQLGRELQREIERLDRSQDKQRLAEVLASFDDFLVKLYDRQEGQTYSSMLWIAETYFGLGQGLASDAAAAAAYFDKAANTYQAILDRAAQEGDQFVSGERLPGVRLRLVNCRRRQGDFPVAFDLAVAVLAEKPNVLEAQLEAAAVLEDWGASGQVDSPEKYLEAIQGIRVDQGQNKIHIWGWAAAANKIKAMLDQRGTADPELEQQHLDARYHISSARRRYGLTKTGAERKRQLERALGEIVTFSRIGGEMLPEWWDKFDALYREIQSDLGVEQPKPLERPVPIVARSATSPAAAGGATAAAPSEMQQPNQAAAPATAAPPTDGGPGVGVAIVGLLLAAAVGAGVFFMMGGGRRRRRSYAGSAGASTARSAAPRPPATAGTARGTPPQRKSPAGGAPKPPRPSSTK
ncbi:MAG: hypothetical protein WD069_00760 [Planctomycetales bacterium]